MTPLEEDLRETLRAHDHDIDPALTRNYVVSVPRRSGAFWPVLAAAVAVSVISIGAYGLWPVLDRGADQVVGAPTSAQQSPSTSGATVAPGGDPADLIASWTVTDTEDTQPITLALTDRGLHISRACGSQGGQWRASVTGLFVADVSDWSPACTDGRTAPAWLTAAHEFAFAGDDVRLLDAEGAIVAVLVRGDSPGTSADPTPTGNSMPRDGEGPSLVPAALEPATPDRLIGRWTPAADGPDGAEVAVQPLIEFRLDGSWVGTDGCNGEGGRWAGDDQGEVLATVGPSTLVACRGMQPIGSWAQEAVAAGFDGDVLVLLGADGQEISRLKHATVR